MTNREADEAARTWPPRTSVPLYTGSQERRPAVGRFGLVLLLAAAVASVGCVVAGVGPHEDQAQAMARCEKEAAYSGLKALDPDHLPAWYSREQLAALPDGTSTLPDGEAVNVTGGCAFVFVTGVRNADGSIGPAPAGATTAP